MKALTLSQESVDRSMDWSWMDSVEDPDDIGEEEINLAYRIHYPVHTYADDKCKRNCRSNPKCYSGLGEAQWIESEESDEEDSDEDILLERRKPGFPAGLKNLGNTCYVNSFLQIWFHNLRFRQALYAWDPELDPEERENDFLLEAEHYSPRGKVASLRSLFAMMEFTNRRAVDPNDLIAKLGLDPQVQQDAQEFSKLFISLLESSLSDQKNVFVKSIVQSQFRGEYYYVTECCKCKRQSKRPSFFYELDLTLQRHKTLADCLADFTKKEKLDGDNQYFCEECNSKQDATRYVRLAQLPPVLNLQLNRFIFDMQTGRKKKLNSFVQFPEKLDMSEYIGEDRNTRVYCLTGVLMHVGAEANHGHYVAHIQEAGTGKWYKFSDAFVERLDGKTQKLGHEIDDVLMNKTGLGKPRVTKGHQGSNNAYMLVYTESKNVDDIRKAEMEEDRKRQHVRIKAKKAQTKLKKVNHKEEEEDLDFELGTDEEAEKSYVYVNGIVYPSNFPNYLRTNIEQDRKLFEEELHESMMSRREKQSERVDLRERLRSIVTRLPYREEDDVTGAEFEFIPSEWLMRYLERPSAASMIETTAYLCIHGRLDLEKLSEVKVIDSEVAEELYEEAGDGSGRRLTHDSLCEICVKNRFRQIKLAQTSRVDSKHILDWLKEPLDDQPCFWVGKLSLKRWRIIAKQNLEDIIAEETLAFNEEMEAAMMSLTTSSSSTSTSSTSSSPPSSSSEEDNEADNEDVISTAIVVKTASEDATPPTIKLNTQNSKNVIACIKRTQRRSRSSDNEGNELMTVEDVQNRLQKIGTNVTVAKVGPSSANPPSKNGLSSSSGGSSITVIHNGESRTLSSISDVKFDELNINKPELKNDKANLKSDKPALKSDTSEVNNAKLEVKNGDTPEVNDDKSEVKNGHTCNGGGLNGVLYPGGRINGGCNQSRHFNEDIACIHGNLCIEEGRRKLVSEKVWNKLHSYFPHCRVFERKKGVVEHCPLCADDLNQAAKEHEAKRETAQRQKAILTDIFNERNRPTWAKSSLNKVYLVSRIFVQKWRNFIRNPTTVERIRDIGNATLLCKHAGLVYPLDLDTESDYESVVFMVWEEEWENIKKTFEVDYEISVVRNKEEGSNMILRSDPEICDECVKQRCEQEELDNLTYHNVVVYVRRLAGGEKLPESDSRDPDFSGTFPNGMCLSYSNKKVKLNNGSSVISSSDAKGGGGGVRRSNRRQKVRGEREFTVSSDMLLRDFKVKVMEAFKVPPYDQNLCLNGLYLTDSSQTLGQLRVLPRSLIYLRADEPSGVMSAEPDEGWSAHHPEEGFKGTGLLSGF